MLGYLQGLMVVHARDIKVLSSLTGLDLYYLAPAFSKIGGWALGVSGSSFGKIISAGAPKRAREAPHSALVKEGCARIEGRQVRFGEST
jgi:hypothetical protein